MLDVIPEYETTESKKDVSDHDHGFDSQVKITQHLFRACLESQ
jgi:hypothetical protein